MTNNAAIPPMPEPGDPFWKLPVNQSILAAQRNHALVVATATLIPTTIIAAVGGLVVGIGGALAFAISAGVCVAWSRMYAPEPRIAGATVYSIAFGVVGLFSLGIIDGLPWQCAWLFMWSVISALVLYAITRSQVVVLGAAVACGLGLLCTVLQLVNQGSFFLACPLWNLAVGISMFRWVRYHRVWAIINTSGPCTRCPCCNYSLIGLHSPTCPECGNTIPTSPPLFGPAN